MKVVLVIGLYGRSRLNGEKYLVEGETPTHYIIGGELVPKNCTIPYIRYVDAAKLFSGEPLPYRRK